MSKVGTQETTGVLLTVYEAAANLRISRWMLYQLIRSHQLRTITIGARRFVPLVDLEAFIERRRREAEP